MKSETQDQHNIEIRQNIDFWRQKPVLQKIYTGFYRRIAQQIDHSVDGVVVELGSGIGNLKTMVPDCICTDMFPNQWIDQQENAYQLSFESSSVSNLILFDVWHHLEFPGSALAEFHRVLKPNGRIIIFEPAVSFLGRIVYGLLHHEPLLLRKDIQWFIPKGLALEDFKYYAAQANASRIFCTSKYANLLSDWEVRLAQRTAEISYVASGGYSGKKLYPDCMFRLMKVIDRFCNLIPAVFATRLLVVLTKNQ